MAPKLKVVTDATAPRVPKSISEALDMGERAVLVAMRAQVAAELDSGKVPAHAIAGLMQKLRDFDRDIRALDQRNDEDEQSSREAAVEDGQFDASAV